MSNPTPKERLIEIVRRRSFSNNREITLASGRKSWLYFNMKPTMMHPEGAALIARLIVDALASAPPDYVGGLEMGAVPLAAAVAPESFRRGAPMGAFFVRKAAKDHGTRSLIEGLAPGESLSGKRAVILEDVTTSGGSAVKAVEIVRSEGADVDTILTVLDREEGAREALAQRKINLISILTAKDVA